jgi:hypothetical protein
MQVSAFPMSFNRLLAVIFEDNDTLFIQGVSLNSHEQ